MSVEKDRVKNTPREDERKKVNTDRRKMDASDNTQKIKTKTLNEQKRNAKILCRHLTRDQRHVDQR